MMLSLSSLLATVSALPPAADIISDATKANNYYRVHEDQKSFDDHSWKKGTYMTGLMELYRATHDTTLLDYAHAWGEANEWKLAGHKKGDLTGPKPHKPHGVDDADNQICAATYAELYALDPNQTYIADAIDVLKAEMEGSETNYWSWVDAIHMGMNAFSRLGNATGDDRYFETMFKFYNVTANVGSPPDGIDSFRLWNSSAKLFYRDARYWGTDVYWSRGVGWAITALARSLELLPQSSKFEAQRQEYESKLVAMAHSLKEIQGADGAWRASLLNASMYPAPETTGSANFAYGIAYGINNGLLSAEEFMPTLEKAWTYLSKMALQPSGLVGYCQPVGSSPAGTSPTTTSDFCVGQFLLAATQIAKLAAKEVNALVV